VRHCIGSRLVLPAATVPRLTSIGRCASVSLQSFTLTDYNNWAIAVNEDQGSLMDGHAGVSSTTGDWQHVAVRCVRSDNARVEACR
jgi:hypothetical protein